MEFHDHNLNIGKTKKCQRHGCPHFASCALRGILGNIFLLKGNSVNCLLEFWEHGNLSDFFKL